MKYDFSVDGVSVEAVFNKFAGRAKDWLSDKLVLVEALELQQLRQKSLPNIDWARAYEDLGFSPAAVKEELAKLKIVESDGYWTAPVLNLKEKGGLTCNMIIARIRERGVTVVCVDDVDGSVAVNARNPGDGSYLRRFPREIEPSRPIKMLSYCDKKEVVKEESTILEAWLLEFGYFRTTGSHLTCKKVVRCGASRSSDGSVPSLSCAPGDSKLCSRWYSSGDPDGYLLARSADFPPTEASGAQPE